MATWIDELEAEDEDLDLELGLEADHDLLPNTVTAHGNGFVSFTRPRGKQAAVASEPLELDWTGLRHE